MNVGPGASTAFACKQVVIQNNPVGAIDWHPAYPGGVSGRGLGRRPGHLRPGRPDPRLGRRQLRRRRRRQRQPPRPARAPTRTTAPTTASGSTVRLHAGTHQVCVYALNAGLGHARLKIRVTPPPELVNPVGANTGHRPGRLQQTRSAWPAGAVDPDTLGPVTVRVTVDGVYKGSTTASAPSTGLAAAVHALRRQPRLQRHHQHRRRRRAHRLRGAASTSDSGTRHHAGLLTDPELRSDRSGAAHPGQRLARQQAGHARAGPRPARSTHRSPATC